MSLQTKKGLTIPSRSDNPFATCWTTPGAIAFRFSDGLSAKLIVAQLAAQHWFGAIVGPHGSGKTTLLRSLKPVLVAAGCQIHWHTLRSDQRRLPAIILHECNSTPARHHLVIIDGFEQLSWLERARIKRHCRRQGAGLLVTSHRPIGIRTLTVLSPDLRLVEQLVGELCAEVSTAVTASDVAASYARRGSNVREILFDLYDLHERRRSRTVTWPS